VRRGTPRSCSCGRDKPSKATVDGKPASWTWVTKPFPGALVEVTPQNGRATVSIG